MEPRWEVIRVTITIIVVIVMLKLAYCIWAASNEQIIAFLSAAQNSGGSPPDRVAGLMAFGLVVILILGLTRILTSPKS